MREKLKYFILNNHYDFSRGICDDMSVHEDELVFSSDKSSGIGRYLTRIFDSGERGMIWHRLLINIRNSSPADLRITVYAADKQEFFVKGEHLTIDSVFHDDSLSLDKKLEVLSGFKVKEINGAGDILLHDVSGRYLWVFLQVYGISSAPAVIKEMWFYLPASSWIDNLPQLYRRSDGESRFLERYLGIFQTLYEEVDSEISKISERFDPECAQSEFLNWLADWLDIADCSMWSDEKLRKLLLMALSLYRGRGTHGSLSRLIELYTGEKPFIIEEFSLRQYAGTPEYENTLLPMYGNDPYKILILIRSEAINSEHDVDVLRRLSREMMPVTVDFELRVLEPYIFLDKYSYLGINSYLGRCKEAVLDGKTQMNFSALGK